MNMEKIEEAAGAVAEELARGLSQDEETAAAVQGLFGTLDPAGLADILSRREESDGATLLAMLVFPDAAMKERLEPLFSRLACDQEEARAVGEAAANRVSRTEAIFPDGTRLALSLTPGDVREFTARLRLADNPPRVLAGLLAERPAPDCAECADSIDSADVAARMLAALRHCRLSWTQPRLFFLSMLLRGLDSGTGSAGDAADRMDAFTWALGYLDALSPDADPAAALSPWIRGLDDRLKTARRNRELMEKGNFETLMSQGVRLPHIHEESVLRELTLARLAARAVLGPEADGLARMEEDLGAYEDPAALIAALGGIG